MLVFFHPLSSLLECSYEKQSTLPIIFGLAGLSIKKKTYLATSTFVTIFKTNII